ncbi:TonB-dependent receptor [Caballeronia grimmiae]|uniref:Ferrichrome-iron receptor n=1 Tax=Caballeronia grimmiae TaxID=1071679 RepID=A0A069NFV6_9BURK|nr:TonB-dependent siderophore receptor [Caballeronia grimmiae]KDR27200.1 TonB-dependent receptor [Caballeronia grimmiae]GGD70051.1 ferrichrome-iron receptor [Caballeronia grimmiae]
MKIRASTTSPEIIDVACGIGRNTVKPDLRVTSVTVAMVCAGFIAGPGAWAAGPASPAVGVQTGGNPGGTLKERIATDNVMPAVTVTGSRISSYTDETSSSTTRTDTPLQDYPASVQVVPSEVLQDRGVTRINQIADNVSGVHAEASYGGNGATFFNIRGFSESNGLRDGFRNYGYYAFRDVQNIDRIEVFKGPAGALYGGIGAVGGYINTVSKRPEPGNFGEVGLTAGSYGLVRTTIDVNRALNDDLSIRVNGSAESNSTFRDNAGYKSWSIAPAITWTNHHGTSVTLLTEYNHLNRDGFDFGIPAVPNYQSLSRTRYYGLRSGAYSGVDGDYGRNDTLSETLLFEQELSSNWKLRLSGQYAYARQHSTQSFPDSTLPTGNLLDYSVYSGANEFSRQYSARAELVGTFVTGTLKHALLAGVDYGYLEVGSGGSAVSTMTLDLFNPNYLSGLTPSDPLPGHQGRGADYGVYVQDLVDLTSQIKLLVGLRADRFINQADEAGEPTGRGQQTTFSPRVGLVWQPTASTSFFTDWNRSHAPNVGHSGGNVTYDAEVAEQIEVGVKQELIKNQLNASVALFNINRNHILTPDPTNPVLEVLTGKQRSRGVEVDIAGNITPRWKAIVTYAYTIAKVMSDNTFPVGDALSNVPRHSASLWTVYQLQSIPGLQVGAGVYYVGPREATLPNTFKLPAYVRTDAMASYQRGPWKTQLNVFNLFNRKYYTGGSAATFDYTLMPSVPLSAQVTVSYAF